MRASLLSSSSSSSSPTLVAALAALLAAGCSSTIIGGGGGIGGDGGASPDATSSSSGWMTTTSSSGSPTGGGCSSPTAGGIPPSGCTPVNAACDTAGSVCLATAHAHGAPQFDLRIGHITISAPTALTTGIVKSVFDGSTMMNLPACNLAGGGAFNWLLRVDAAAGAITVGGSKPVQDPAAGYSFVNEVLPLGGAAFPVTPATAPATLGPTCGLMTAPCDVFLPFYGDQAGSIFTLFPLRSLQFSAAVTPDHDCIGSFNAAGLSPANVCQPDDLHPSFLDGGQLDAFIHLEDADSVLVPVLNETLCVLLSNDPATYADGSSPRKCKRDAANQIVLQGDWCSATNAPAGPGCADAMRFSGAFAAQGVKITP